MLKALTYIYAIYNNRNSHIEMSKQTTMAAIAVMFSGLWLFTAPDISFAQQSSQQAAPQVQKSLEDLEDYDRLEKKIESGEKAYIKDIVVNGITVLNREEVKAVIEPYLKHWLTQKDIQQLVDSLKELYQKKSQAPPRMSYRVEGNKLTIEIEE